MENFIELDEVFKNVPATMHFVETKNRAKVKNLGCWLSTIDEDSIDYMLGLFNPTKDEIHKDECLPVKDIVSLCLLIKEWESGEPFCKEYAWNDALPLIPRLRRSLLIEKLHRNGVLMVLRISILDDDFDVKLCNEDGIDEILANLAGYSLLPDMNKLILKD